ncbi:hypothetical protein PAL_GLEAN10013202 [Pteropus alecto]|uniref:Uncharacterized protein n=1 Tax=Pteropus alecto TaxID=9402 RepID=L5KGR5_PTEAL|nr:hypothetical protein PAL_GLEAN10013202 [Pteropus alecto]
MTGVLVAVGGSASQGGQEGTPGGGDRAEQCAERRGLHWVKEEAGNGLCRRPVWRESRMKFLMETSYAAFLADRDQAFGGSPQGEA